jgi:hypothetical protein
MNFIPRLSALSVDWSWKQKKKKKKKNYIQKPPFAQLGRLSHGEQTPENHILSNPRQPPPPPRQCKIH